MRLLLGEKFLTANKSKRNFWPLNKQLIFEAVIYAFTEFVRLLKFVLILSGNSLNYSNENQNFLCSKNLPGTQELCMFCS